MTRLGGGAASACVTREQHADESVGEAAQRAASDEASHVGGRARREELDSVRTELRSLEALLDALGFRLSVERKATG